MALSGSPKPCWKLANTSFCRELSSPRVPKHFSSQVLSIKGHRMLLQVIVNMIYFELCFKEEKLTSKKNVGDKSRRKF